MAIQNQGWAYVSGSGTGGTTSPGGSDGNIQFNNNGSFSGSGSLITDGSGSLSASVNISASAFYGDGSNLTGITASAVNVADGPEFSLQWRYDTPSNGDLSGSQAITWNTSSLDLIVTGNVRIQEDYEFYGDIEGAVRFPAQVDEAGGITRGQVVYINGISGQTPTVGLAACDDASKMPAFGLAGQTAADGDALQVITLGSLKNLNLTALYDQTFAVGDVVYVQTGSGGNAGKLTNVRPKGSGNLLQNIGKVVRDGGGGDGQIKVGGAGRTNATPNLDKGYLFVGDDTNCSSQDNTVFISSSANRVGINNTNPQASLHISSSTDNVSLLRVDSQSEADAILFVTGSGRVGIGTSDPGIGGSSDTMLDVQGHLTIGKAGTAYIFNNNDSDTYMKFGGSVPPGTDGMQFVVGGKRMLMLDEDGADKVTLGSAGTDVVYVSGSLTVSASAANGEDIFVGSGTSRTIGVLVDGADDFFEIGHDAGAITLSASAGVEFVAGSDGVGSFGSDIKVYATQDGNNTVVSLTNGGAVSGSTKLESGGTLTVAGISTFNNTVNLNAAVTSSNIIVSTTPAGTGAGLQLSASNTSFGPGQVYGQLYFGSGSIGGSGWSGTEISLSDFGGGEEFEFRAKNGATTVRADNGDATLRATAGEVILSGSAGIVGQTTVNLNAGLSTNNNSVSINAGMSVNNTALTINSSLQNNGISTFNDTATFNNSASVHNQGINVNNARGTFNSGLTVNNASAIFNDSVTLGDASGDGVTWNAGSWNMSANSVVTTLKDGVDGVGGNGALMFFTGSGGDFMKFHTSGSAKGIVFPQQTYLSKGGALSGSAAGAGSYLALDSSNKIVITSSAGASTSPGGSDTQIQFNQNGSFAGSSGLVYNGSGSLSIGTSTPKTTLDIHYTGSGNPVGLSNDTGGGEIVYFGTSSADLTAGGVYYLNQNGGWESVSSATTGSGHNQLLGIALGTKAGSNGILLNGYFDVTSFYSGSFIKGAPVYIQSSSVPRPVVGGGYLSSSAPTAADSYVRVVGYGTDTPNVVYFNPDSTYIELS